MPAPPESGPHYDGPFRFEFTMPPPTPPNTIESPEEGGAAGGGSGGIDPTGADVSLPPAPRPLSGRLAGMSLNRQVFVLSLWPFLQQLLSWLVSTVDTAVAGRLPSESSVNAIGVAGYINWFMGLMVMGIGTGGAALIARAVGRGHRSLANAGVGQTLVLGVLVGVIVGVVINILAVPIGLAAGLGADSLSQSTVYLRITAGFVPVAAVLFVGSSCLTAAGDTRAPFLVMVLMNAVNLVATIVLAVNLGWGVAGIAWGTAIGWTVGAALMMILMTRRTAAARLHLHRLRPHAHTIQRIWRVARGNLFDRGGHWAGNWLVVMLVGYIGVKSAAWGKYGDDLQGAHIIAIRIESISFLPALAFATAAGTLTGQYLGVHDRAMAKRAARRCWLLGAGAMTVLGVAFVAVPELLVTLYTDHTVFHKLSPDLVRICGFVQFFFGSALVLQGAMRGAGDTRVPAILSNTLTWGVRLPAAFVLGYVFDMGLTGVWLALCGELFLRGIVFIARYRGEGWLSVEV